MPPKSLQAIATNFSGGFIDAIMMGPGPSDEPYVLCQCFKLLVVSALDVAANGDSEGLVLRARLPGARAGAR